MGLRIHKIALFLIVIVYFLTPYSVKGISVNCTCGNGEFICYCCVKSPDYGDVASLSKCRGNVISDESYTQLPATIPNLSEAFIISYKINDTFPKNNVFLKGYNILPFRPPHF